MMQVRQGLKYKEMAIPVPEKNQIKIFQDEQTGLKWIETKRVILSKKHPPKATLGGCF